MGLGSEMTGTCVVLGPVRMLSGGLVAARFPPLVEFSPEVATVDVSNKRENKKPVSKQTSRDVVEPKRHQHRAQKKPKT